MFKFLTIVLVALCFKENSATVIPYKDVLYNHIQSIDIPDITAISSKWEQHIIDFIELIDIDRVLGVALGYLSDPEVLNFMNFIFSDDFKKFIWDLESITEFKEAFKFLSDKGYEVDSAIGFINNALQLPPFEKPRMNIAMNRKGMTGLIEDMIAALPMEEFKKLFERKLKTSPEVAELFETINSPEFLDINKRMSKNPEFQRLKDIFEGYGFDFKYLCQLSKKVLGEYYQGVFCE